MLSGYALANSKRSWYVPGFNIWGTAGWGNFEFLLVEQIGSTKTIFFDKANLGEGAQEVSYNQLTDFRGNFLPAVINNPKIFIKQKSEDISFVIGEETNQEFKIARSSQSSGPVTVDLYIVEMN